jgi:hypothetical protein
VQPQRPFYAKAGYTNARAKLRYDDGTGSIFHDSDISTAISSAAGAEFSMGRIRAEYRFAD